MLALEEDTLDSKSPVLPERNPHLFSQSDVGFLFSSLKPWAREPGVELRPLPCSSEETSAAEISLLSFNRHTVGMGSACFMSLPHLSVLMWLLLYIRSYRTGVQLVFRRFSMMVIL